MRLLISLDFFQRISRRTCYVWYEATLREFVSWKRGAALIRVAWNPDMALEWNTNEQMALENRSLYFHLINTMIMIFNRYK